MGGGQRRRSVALNLLRTTRQYGGRCSGGLASPIGEASAGGGGCGIGNATTAVGTPYLDLCGDDGAFTVTASVGHLACVRAADEAVCPVGLGVVSSLMDAVAILPRLFPLVARPTTAPALAPPPTSTRSSSG